MSACPPRSRNSSTVRHLLSASLFAFAALAAAWLAKRVGAVQRGMHWLDKAAGAMFVGFGLKLALTDNPTS